MAKIVLAKEIRLSDYGLPGRDCVAVSLSCQAVFRQKPSSPPSVSARPPIAQQGCPGFVVGERNDSSDKYDLSATKWLRQTANGCGTAAVLGALSNEPAWNTRHQHSVPRPTHFYSDARAVVTIPRGLYRKALASASKEERPQALFPLTPRALMSHEKPEMRLWQASHLHLISRPNRD